MTETLNNEQLALQNLREDIEEMMNTVLAQLNRAQEALRNCDKDLAHEILAIEKKINSMDLRIDKSCERILALYNPLAANLRFTLAVMSISNQLERIADHAKGIADYIDQDAIDKPFEDQIIKSIHFNEMFETALSMIDDSIYSFLNEDTNIVKWVFGKEKGLNKLNKEASVVIETLVANNPDKIKQLLHLFSITKKLERIGDLSKNIAEETVFFVDAKKIKHKKKKKYLPK